MPLVTLIGELLAQEGTEFTYLGPNNDCRNCKLKTVCFNLKPGRRYEITKIRDKQHDCTVHEGNVVVVEVTERPLVTAMSKKPVEGTAIKINQTPCKHIGCPHIELCSNIALQKGKTYKVKKVYEQLECPAGHELYRVEVTE
jgi:hypothetical protein